VKEEQGCEKRTGICDKVPYDTIAVIITIKKYCSGI
jgi:hypothetical protein